MTAGGISKRLVNFASALVGRFTGGLGMVDILTSVIFAGVSGSAAADTAAIGSIMIEPMKKKGYTKGLACVIQATAGSLGPIIPPSMTMIIYCSITNQSIGELFMAEGGQRRALLKKRKRFVKGNLALFQGCHNFLQAFYRLFIGQILVFTHFYSPHPR